jgi:hypothetical protein
MRSKSPNLLYQQRLKNLTENYVAEKGKMTGVLGLISRTRSGRNYSSSE